MRNILTVYRKECASSFNSPIAYIFIGAFLAIMAFLFFILFRFFSSNSPEIRQYFVLFPFTLFIFIPAIAMRLWSEEKKQGTIELLMTLPLKPWELVVAKFLAGYTIVFLSLLLSVSVPIGVSFVVEPIDWKALVASYIGVFLIAGVYLAIGSWISAMSENQIVAFVVSIVACALVCFMGVPQVTDWINQNVFEGLGLFIGYLGSYSHSEKFAQGQVSLVDVVYAFSMIGFFLGLSNFAVESRKF